MRLDINLASQPYQDAGRFYRRWLLALFAMTLFSVVLVYAATTAWRDSREASSELRSARQKLAQLDAWQKADKEILDQPENSDVRDRSELLNGIIRRKAFSWTQAFSDMERLMPARLHVTAMKPELTSDNQLAIHMSVAGDSRDRALELLRRMEQSKSFRQPTVDAEKNEVRPPDTVAFDISALYTPQPPSPAAAPTPAAPAPAAAPPQQKPSAPPARSPANRVAGTAPREVQ